MRPLWLLLWAAGAALGVAAETAAYEWGEVNAWLPDLAAGWTLIACGLTAVRQPGGGRSGALLAAAGFAWFLPNFGAGGLLYLHRGPLVHALITFPDGRVRGRVEGAAVAAGYAAAVVATVWASEAATLVLAALVVAVAALGRARAVGAVRRMRLGALYGTAVYVAVLAATAAARLAFPTTRTDDLTLLAYEAALCVLSIGLLGALVRRPWERSRVADLVVDLGEARSGSLQEALAAAVGDPTLEVGYRLGDGYVDAEGHAVALPAPGAARRVTPVDLDGEPLAVLIHDPAVLDDPRVAAALAAAARLASANARLQGEVREQLSELRASRRRLVRAEDSERRRLERRLRQTVIARLGALEHELVDADAGAGEHLARSLSELRELGAGLDPGHLGERTLAEALRSLVDRSPVAVTLTVSSSPLPEELASAAYFVCSEALANAVKYACARHVSITVEAGSERLRVEVADDGLGGARPTPGGGLGGLGDRVEALGGTFAIESPPGAGTRVTAELPLRR